MTTPEERTRSILQAGAFLKELHADTTLPDAVRQEAHRLLRHFPTVRDVTMMATVEAKGLDLCYLTSDFDSAWTQDYPLGPHTR